MDEVQSYLANLKYAQQVQLHQQVAVYLGDPLNEILVMLEDLRSLSQ